MNHGIDPSHFMQYIIRPSLIKINLYSDDAAILLLGTAVHETSLGRFLHQLAGPALGVYQIEPDTHVDIWENYIEFRAKMRKDILKIYPDVAGNVDNNKLIYDLQYATIIARLVYRRVPEKLPNRHDVIAQAEYWKIHYNTLLGKGYKSRYIQNMENIGCINGNL